MSEIGKSNKRDDVLQALIHTPYAKAISKKALEAGVFTENRRDAEKAGEFDGVQLRYETIFNPAKFTTDFVLIDRIIFGAGCREIKSGSTFKTVCGADVKCWFFINEGPHKAKHCSVTEVQMFDFSKESLDKLASTMNGKRDGDDIVFECDPPFRLDMTTENRILESLRIFFGIGFKI